MKGKHGLAIVFGSLLLAVALFGAEGEARADGDFYVIPITSMTFRGDWDTTETYKAKDVVFYQGSSWFSLVGPNKGHAPHLSPDQWTLLAQKGAAGAPGPQGPQGPQGATGPQGPAGPANPNVTTTGTNTAVGTGALNPGSTGSSNTASGSDALHSNTSGYYNAANGYAALHSNTVGYENTASGTGALFSNTTGYDNTAAGYSALLYNTTGHSNTATGFGALYSNSTGHNNTALGYKAGHFSGAYSTGSNNVYIGSEVYPDSANESNTIRIGNGDTDQTFISGILGKMVYGQTVSINSSGRLGLGGSSLRYKEEIHDMGDASSRLMDLRPVTFYYKPRYLDGARTLQYGLIAEEVAKVSPELVQYNPTTGEPQTVAYHLVNAMLLNEVQKQHHQIVSQQEEISDLKERLSEMSNLNERLSRLEGLLRAQLATKN